MLPFHQWSLVGNTASAVVSNLWEDTPSSSPRVKSRCHSSYCQLSFSDACWAQECCIHRTTWITLEWEESEFQMQHGVCQCTTAHPVASKGRISPMYCQHQPRSSPFLRRDQLDHWRAYLFCGENQFYVATSFFGKSCLVSHEHIKLICHCYLCSRRGRLQLLSITQKLHEWSQQQTHLVELQKLVNNVEWSFSWVGDTALSQLTLL